MIMESQLGGSTGSLCFKEKEFLADNFSVDKFVSRCKDRVSMTNLREDLEVHYKSIQLALIELINRDYADFVSLSSNLIGTERIIENLDIPLGQLKEEVATVKTDLSHELDELNSKLEERKIIRDKKSRLHHLMNVVYSVEKIEKILTADPTSPDMELFMNEDKTRPGHFLERIAGEFNQLQFHVNQSKGHPIIESIIPRVALITSKLQTNLEATFEKGISSDQSEIILRCLRTYALIDKTAHAEVLFRNTVVKPFAKEIINEAYHAEHGTKKLCDDIINFIDEDCKIILDLTTDVSKKKDHMTDDKSQSVKGFDFLVNSVWVEIVESFEERLPLLFSPGNPDLFLTRYRDMMSFMDQLEERCVSAESFKALRSHPGYNTFMIKWSLPVYFQIRFQEIGGKIEVAAETPFVKSPEENQHKNETIQENMNRLRSAKYIVQNLFMTNIVGQCWLSIVQCWHDNVYISPLKGRLWKLTLQIISRLAVMMTSAVSSENPSNKITSIEHVTLLLGDTCYFVRKVRTYFTETISKRLKDAGSVDTKTHQAALEDGCDNLNSSINLIKAHLIERLASEGASHLDDVKNVPRLYRRTNKDPPTQPSAYVASAFKAVEEFKSNSSTLEDEQQKDIIEKSISNMTSRYCSAVYELLTSIKKTEESLLRLKQQRKVAAGQSGVTAGVKGNEVSDENKIRKQIDLDAVEYGVQINSMNLSSDDYPEYLKLKDITKKAVEPTLE